MSKLGEYSTFKAFDKIREEISILTEETCEIHNIKKFSVKNQEPICELCHRITVEERIQDRVLKSIKWEKDRRTSKVLTIESIVDDKEIREATLENFETETDEEKAALLFAKRTSTFYTDGGTGNTILTGKQGTGKSHLAMGIAKEINKRGDLSVMFMSFPRVVQLVQSSIRFPDSKYTFEGMLEILKRPDFLILDDVGRERRVERGGMSYAEDILVSVLNGRKNTIVTTNYSSKELGEIYNLATASRVMKGVGKDHAFVFKNIRDRRISNGEHFW